MFPTSRRPSPTELFVTCSTVVPVGCVKVNVPLLQFCDALVSRVTVPTPTPVTVAPLVKGSDAQLLDPAESVSPIANVLTDTPVNTFLLLPVLLEVAVTTFGAVSDTSWPVKVAPIAPVKLAPTLVAVDVVA